MTFGFKLYTKSARKLPSVFFCRPGLSFIKNTPIRPPTVGIIPRSIKNFFQSSVVAAALVSPSKPTNTTAMASSGSTAKMVSTLLRLAVFVISVIQVLKDASLLMEPITDITQSMTTTKITIALTLSGAGCIGIRAKAIMVKPQITYPQVINTLRLPVRSQMAPPSSVDSVANSAENATISVVA